MMRLRRRRAVAATCLFVLCAGGTAAADVLNLPSNGSQVNSDPALGIDPSQDANQSDLAAGSLMAGGENVPWAAFEQATGSAQQIFVRAFKNGAWNTEGSPASLNFDATQVAQHPGIDFAGPGRAVPWVTWYEPTLAFNGGAPHPGVKNVFASNFSASSNVWIRQGQSRPGTGANPPSLNIHTNRTAEDPALAGGTATPSGTPTPWVAWEENDGFAGADPLADQKKQIFVSRGIGPVTGGSCAGDKPATTNTVGTFCWQQVGADRIAQTTGASSPSGDPSLSIDPARESHTPDITFTGSADTVPWVVWYEQTDAAGPGTSGLATNELVFAAKAIPDSSAGVDGGFHWQAVGAGTAGHANPIDTSSGGFGPCASSLSAERACSLNANAVHDAEHPSVATGSLSPATPTVPWVAWDENTGNGNHAIFVSRLVGGDHFELFNGGAPLSNPSVDAVTPDITFFGNIPYVSWVQHDGSALRGFVGHFTQGSFLLDTPSGVPLGPPSFGTASLSAFPVAISSSCTSNPFTADGNGCPVGQINAPFFTFTTAGSPQRLFGEAATGGFNPVLFPSAVVLVGQPSGAFIEGSLAHGDTVGILVQRILGTKRVHGQVVLVLQTVGKVPLGHHNQGRLKIKWNLKVNGHRLKPGRYLITLRAFDSVHHLLGTAKPVIFRIK